MLEVETLLKKKKTFILEGLINKSFCNRKKKSFIYTLKFFICLTKVAKIHLKVIYFLRY